MIGDDTQPVTPGQLRDEVIPDHVFRPRRQNWRCKGCGKLSMGGPEPETEAGASQLVACRVLEVCPECLDHLRSVFAD